MIKKTFGFSKLYILLLLLGIFSVGFYFYYQRNTSELSSLPKTQEPKRPEISPPVVPENEFYEYKNQELSIKMLIPKVVFRMSSDPCYSKEVPVKVYHKSGTNSIFIYSEVINKNCEISNINPDTAFQSNTSENNALVFKVYNFKSRNELENLIKENFGKYCKIKSIELNENKKTKRLEMDDSFFKSEEYKKLSSNGGGAYWEYCSYPGKTGTPMYINLEENKIIFNKGTLEYLNFSYWTDKNRKDYDPIIFNSIEFIK